MQLFDTLQVSKILSIKKTKVVDLIKKGELRGIKLSKTSKRYYVKKEDLDSFINSLDDNDYISIQLNRHPTLPLDDRE